MMPRAMATNQRPGITYEIHCSGAGMLSSGKINPDSRMLGSIVPSSAPIIAIRCDEVRAEMRMPSDSETRM